MEAYNTQNPDNADTYLAEGHWVIGVGYQNQKNRKVFYQGERFIWNSEFLRNINIRQETTK